MLQSASRRCVGVVRGVTGADAPAAAAGTGNLSAMFSGEPGGVDGADPSAMEDSKPLESASRLSGPLVADAALDPVVLALVTTFLLFPLLPV